MRGYQDYPGSRVFGATVRQITWFSFRAGAVGLAVNNEPAVTTVQHIVDMFQ